MTSPRAPPPRPLATVDKLRLHAQLCFALYATSLAMTKLYMPLRAPLDLTFPQYLVMRVLWEQDDRPVHELGELLRLDGGTLTPLLKRMETAGLVSRQRDVTDERRVRILLTPQGRAPRQRAQLIPDAIGWQAGLATQELTTLCSELHRLRLR